MFSYIEESTALLCAPPSIRHVPQLFRLPPCSGCYTQADAGKLRSPNLCICILVSCPPPKARSEVVFFQGQLTAPLSYSVNTCREYDKSHCRVRGLGTDREREYCKDSRRVFMVEGDGGSQRGVKLHRHKNSPWIIIDISRNQRRSGVFMAPKHFHHDVVGVPSCITTQPIAYHASFNQAQQ